VQLQDFKLPIPLHSLEGPKKGLKRLQAVLREVEGQKEQLDKVSTLLEKLKNAGYTKEEFWEKLRSYLAGERPDDQVLRDLDLRLLACHHILLEDFPKNLLEELLEDESYDMDKLRRKLYGASHALPILTREMQAEASSVDEMATRKRRQLIIERITLEAALRSYREELEARAAIGLGATDPGTQKIWKAWVSDITAVLQDMSSSYSSGRGSKSFKELQESELEPELMAVIACQNALNLMFLPHYRHKDDRLAASRQGKFGEVPFATMASVIGQEVQTERASMASRSVEGLESPERGRMMLRRWRASAYMDVRKTVAIGAALADLLIRECKVYVPADQVPELAGTLPPGEKIQIEAFQHRLRREGKKSVGVVSLHPVVRSMMESEEDLLRFIQPKHKPMVMKPLRWRPAGLGPEGPYLIHHVHFMRTSEQSQTCLVNYNPSRVASVMDFLGQIPWKINQDMLDLMTEVKRLDLDVADIPLQKDPEVPPLPTEEQEKSLSEQELKEMRLRHNNTKKQCRKLQSERPTFDLKLQVAEEFRHAEEVYFPHNVDFRGRAYPVPPHLNHIGDDVSRGLLMFANGKALGPDGLFWLKVNLANLFGRNKVPLTERAAWVDEQREQIFKVVDAPLDEENRKWWTNASDGPWQALARCFELVEVWTCDAPEDYQSYLPVHMDGSCNGLQHYAALGRDVEGAKAVNLVPADHPQDVYTVVLEVVKKKVKADSEDLEEKKEKESKHAKRLLELDVLQRKVVKQTVMTVCYGVTRVGARQQVQGQLEDLVGDQVEEKEVRELAQYLSSTVLKSIEDVFAGAKRIQDWFGQISKKCNLVQAPVSWVSPLGLSCSQPYHKPETVKITSRRQEVTIKTGHKSTVHKVKQTQGFPPNFVHSMDATHMMMVAERCQQQGIQFAAVHDSFWTHAGDVPMLNKSIREAFVELYEKPVLQDFYEDLCVHLGGQQVPPVPVLGDLDISVVRDSTYLFS